MTKRAGLKLDILWVTRLLISQHLPLYLRQKSEAQYNALYLPGWMQLITLKKLDTTEDKAVNLISTSSTILTIHFHHWHTWLQCIPSAPAKSMTSPPTQGQLVHRNNTTFNFPRSKFWNFLSNTTIVNLHFRDRRGSGIDGQLERSCFLSRHVKKLERSWGNFFLQWWWSGICC